MAFQGEFGRGLPTNKYALFDKLGSRATRGERTDWVRDRGFTHDEVDRLGQFREKEAPKRLDALGWRQKLFGKYLREKGYISEDPDKT